MKEWFTNAELAALGISGFPDTQRGILKWFKKRDLDARFPNKVRRRKGRGGGVERHMSLLPLWAQADLVHRHGPGPAGAKPPSGGRMGTSDAWAFYERLPDSRKAKAAERLEALESVEVLWKGGFLKDVAVQMVARQRGVRPSTIYNWFNLVAGLDRADRLPALAPHQVGRTRTTACDARAWDMLCADYLRSERPTFKSCFRRMARTAEKEGWTIPSHRTLERRIKTEFSEVERKLVRYGLEAVKRMFPAQERDKSVFHALEAVNADGHVFDVWVAFPDGEVLRPTMTAFQDVYSGLFLSWRIDKSENKEAVRLAFGDVVDTYGIPDLAYLDNGRGFASKWLTGGIANRYRFKIKPEDPVGILTQMGVEVHWTTPYSGQSKPIERGFRDFCDNIAKHPAFAGAWTGNTPLNKPENYGSKAVPLETFLKVVADGIREHNARTGRRSPVCHGRSFAETFEDSYAKAPIKRASEEQRRLWLLAAEGVKASSRDGALRLMDNRYWADFLQNHLGQPLVVRFDPQNLHDGVHVYLLDGAYLGFAGIIEASGFNDVDAAREHGRARRAYLKGVKASLEAKKRMDIGQVAELLPEQPEPSPVEAHVVRPVFERPVKATRRAPESVPLSESEQATHQAVIEDLSMHRPEPKEETPADRFRKAMALQAEIEAKKPIDAAESRWLKGYLTTSEFKSQKTMFDDFGEAALQG